LRKKKQGTLSSNPAEGKGEKNEVKRADK